jgi:hypothetical protein
MSTPATMGEAVTRLFDDGLVDHTSRPDVCSYLFKFCRYYQREVFNPRGITCLFDVHSGPMAAWRCDLLGRIMQAIIDDIFLHAHARTKTGQVTVSLKRAGEFWALAIADQEIRSYPRPAQVPPLPCLQGMALQLNGVARARVSRHGGVTGVIFPDQPWFDAPVAPSSTVTPEAAIDAAMARLMAN